MSDTLRTFVELGIRHIISWDALDHLLFLIALAAAHRSKDWRALLAVISAFTVGHSVTLGLAVTRTLSAPSAIVELLIPVTIVFASLDALMVRSTEMPSGGRWRRPTLAALFGLVHGAGFAGYLNSLAIADFGLPLVGFNVGIEIGQLVVMLGLLVVFALLDAGLDALLPESAGKRSAFTWRRDGVSALVLLSAIWMVWVRIV